MPGLATRLRRQAATLARWMNLASGWVFVVCAVFITLEVLARNFLGFSTRSTTELSGYMLAVGISWGLAHALAERSHVRVDVLINKLPAGIRQYLHLVALALLLVFAVAMAYGAVLLVRESADFNAADMSGLRTPLVIPQGIWAFGIIVLALFSLILLVESTALVFSGRGDEAERLLSTKTYEDEAREVLEATHEGQDAGGKGT